VRLIGPRVLSEIVEHVRDFAGVIRP
jgi:hypothetical protein